MAHVVEGGELFAVCDFLDGSVERVVVEMEQAVKFRPCLCIIPLWVATIHGVARYDLLGVSFKPEGEFQ